MTTYFKKINVINFLKLLIELKNTLSIPLKFLKKYIQNFKGKK